MLHPRITSTLRFKNVFCNVKNLSQMSRRSCTRKLNEQAPLSFSVRQHAEEATPSLTSPSALHTSVSIATHRTTLRRTSCGCRASPAATCTPSPPSPWTLSPGRTSPPQSFRGNIWSSGRSWGRGSSERWAGRRWGKRGCTYEESLHKLWPESKNVLNCS